MKPYSKITSIISFGILLLVISFVLNYTAYKTMANTLAKMGVIFEIYAGALYLMNRFKKSKNG